MYARKLEIPTRPETPALHAGLAPEPWPRFWRLAFLVTAAVLCWVVPLFAAYLLIIP